MKSHNPARGWHRFLFFVMMLGLLGMGLSLPLANFAIGVYGLMVFCFALIVFCVEIFWRSINL